MPEVSASGWSYLMFASHGLLLHLSISVVMVLLVQLIASDRRASTCGYRVLLALSTVFWFWHYQWVVQTGAGWELPAEEPLGMYPGLRDFVWLSPLATYMLLWSALSLTARPEWWASFAAATFPALVFLITWFVTLPLLKQGVPGEPYVADNMPQIWLFFESAAATGALLAWAWGMRSNSFDSHNLG
ncbi:MAG TPA: hypothetical protein EYP04_11020 [Anaerolineae bacterium]|nr:hypothetical protein [Anaerolineae bacterium]